MGRTTGVITDYNSQIEIECIVSQDDISCQDLKQRNRRLELKPPPGFFLQGPPGFFFYVVGVGGEVGYGCWYEYITHRSIEL